MAKIGDNNYQILEGEQAGPSPDLLHKAKFFNRFATISGMTSLGVLAALITHHSLEDRDWPLPLVITIDLITFITAVSGKAAIILFFNEEPFIEAFKKIYQKELPDYFKLHEKNSIEKLQWGVNFLLSLNASLFWSGLVAVSFAESGKLLKQFNTDNTRIVGEALQQWYTYLPFLLFSFYANMMAWPNIHSEAYRSKIDFIEDVKRDPDPSSSRRKNLDYSNAYVKRASRKVLKEVKDIIEGGKRSPLLDKLTGTLYSADSTEDDLERTRLLDATVQKIDILTERKDPVQLYDLYSKNGFSTEAKPASQNVKIAKHAIATGISATAIYGFRNTLGLSDHVWGKWGAKSLSKNALGPLVYYSNAESILLTVYPLVCIIFDACSEGLEPSILSEKQLTLIMAMLLFIGLFGGLANAEQSYLDGESTFDIINADIASFLVDAFAIYMVLKSHFEAKIKEHTATNLEVSLSQRFLKLQQAHSEMHPCEEMQNNDCFMLWGALVD